MEQVEGGDLIVNKGNESKPKEGSNDKRELNAVEGYEAAVKLAQVYDLSIHNLCLYKNLCSSSPRAGQRRRTCQVK